MNRTHESRGMKKRRQWGRLATRALIALPLLIAVASWALIGVASVRELSYQAQQGVMPAGAQETIPLVIAATATPTAPSPPEGVVPATETIPPSTPLATLTPSQTLRPPPTFEPPTPTIASTSTPTVTATPTVDLSISIEGLRGLETPTPTSTQGCEVRADWQLTYTVQAHDTLTTIAERYNTTVWDMQAANCLTNPDLIVIGQELRVPGEAQPVPGIECVAWQVLTPFEGMITVPGDGMLTFNWIGPQAPLNLIRITKPDGEVIEELVELRQNAMIDMTDRIPDEGWYTWYVYPLDRNFVQIACHEGGPWTFRKDASGS